MDRDLRDERLRFVARLLEGGPMSDVCREFGISRKTGYQLFERYREEGPVALADRSRRPVRYANQLPAQVESLIIAKLVTALEVDDGDEARAEADAFMWRLNLRATTDRPLELLGYYAGRVLEEAAEDEE